MKVIQEQLPASQIGLEIEVTAEMSKQAYESVLKDFTRSLNVPGFRKGKVPRQVLIQRFGMERIKASVVEELVDIALKQALKQEEIPAIGNFQLRSSFDDLIRQFEPGHPLTFQAAVDVQPQVTLNQHQGFTVQAEEVKLDPARIDGILDNYRNQIATLIPVEERPAQKGDMVVVDYHGRYIPLSDGDEPTEPQDIPGGQAEDFEVELEDGRFIEGFTDGIIGMQLGQTKEITTQFPEDYPEDSIAGCTATFDITLKEIKEKQLPELDDDFAQEATSERFKTLAEWRTFLEERLTEEAADKTQDNKEEALLAELLKHIEVDLPATLIDRETEFLVSQTAYQLQNQGIDVRQFLTKEMITMLKERSRPDAIDRIKRTLCLGEIAKRESISAPESEVKERIKETLENLENSRDIDRDRLQEVVEENLLKEKILVWLTEHCTIELVPEGTLKPEPSESTHESEIAESEDESEAIAVNAEVVDG